MFIRIALIIFIGISTISLVSCQSDVEMIETETLPYEELYISNVRVLKFLPSEETAAGHSIVIFPGGAYETVCWDSEGLYWARYFTELGLNTYVIDYHLPAGNPEIPFNDGVNALKYIRDNNPEKCVGILGLSAGGNLAALLATKSPLNVRPDFQILFYPVISLSWTYTHYTTRVALIGSTEDDEIIRQYSPECNIDEATPGAFIAVCKDDELVNPLNSSLYHDALSENGIPSLLKIYEQGGHGWNDTSPLITFLKSDLTEWINHEIENKNYQRSNTSSEDYDNL